MSLSFWYSDYVIHLFISVAIYIPLVQGLNLIFGVGRMLNLAHAAAFAVGAYAAALGSTKLTFGIGESLVVGVLVSVLLALFIGGISLRLSREYFAIGTLAFSSTVMALIINLKDVTNGVLGVSGIPRPELWGVDFYQIGNFALLTLVIVIVVSAFVWVLMGSSFIRSIRAQAESDISAAALGFDTRFERVLCFCIGSALAGISGVLFAYYMNYIDPTSFTINETIFVLSAVIIGRPGSFWGVIGATTILVLLPEPLRQIEMRPGLIGPLRQLLQALLLFGVVCVQRKRLFPPERRV